MPHTMICIVEGCDKEVKRYTKRGWCGMHYQRWSKTGDVNWQRPSTEERFWTKVDRSLGDNSCWEWCAGLTQDGYGQFALTHSEPIHAHRYSFQLVKVIPDGLELDHLCRNRVCVNPNHLEPVTPVVNNLRGDGPCARNARKTHCKWGHEFTSENTYWRPAGGRSCITCREENKRRYQARAA